MTERHSFLSAIRESPDDDTPRLVYADWLEEHGEPERAEFIRCQIELAVQVELATVYSAKGRAVSIGTTNPSKQAYCDRFNDLRRRERELLADRGYGWADGLLGDGWKTDGRSKDGDSVTVRFFRAAESRDDQHWTDEIRLGFARGFLSRIRCSWEDWQANGDAILKDPWVPGLDKVVLTSLPVAESIDSDQILWAFFGLHSSHRLHRRFFDITMTPGNTSGMRIDERMLRQAWTAVRDWELPPEADEVTARDVEAIIAQRTMTAGNWRDPTS